MLHCDADTLALVALGEPLEPDERRHLSVCVRCQTELDQNQAVVATGRSVTPEDEPSEPAPEVWAAIAGELRLGDGLLPFVPDAAEPRRAQIVSLADRRQQASRSRRTAAMFATAAAVAGIAIGALSASLFAAPETADPGTVIASSELAVVPVEAGGSATLTGQFEGTARIIESGGGAFAEVDARGLPPVDGFYEVWLIRGDLSGMLSLGALTAGSQGRFTVPPGTDLTAYTIVDVSVEALDGDPAHSKESVLRGTLPA